MWWYNGVTRTEKETTTMKTYVDRDDLRVGDEVLFCCGPDFITVIGIVEKVNKKSIKVRQTNDRYYWTRAAFGNYGGRKVGGEGFVHAVPCSKAGKFGAAVRFSSGQLDRMKDTARGAMMRRQAAVEALESLGMLTGYARRAKDAGCSEAEIRAEVDAILTKVLVAQDSSK